MQKHGVNLTAHGKRTLAAVADWLEEGAPHISTVDGRVIDHFNMEFGVTTFGNECGTTCCIAGAIVQFEGLGILDRYGDITYFKEEGGGVGSLASYYCTGVDDHLKPLFLPWVYFNHHSKVYEHDDPKPFSNAERAAKTIRHLLATGVIDWSVNEGMFSQKDCPDDLHFD